jgi:hypothetical protein
MEPPRYDEWMSKPAFTVLCSELERRLISAGVCRGIDHTLAILEELQADGLIADVDAALAGLEDHGALCDCDVI